MNLLRRMALGAMLLVVGPLAAQAADPAVGHRILSVTAPERGVPIEVDLWYPAAAGGVAESYGASPLFVGVPAQKDAPVAEGRFPLVLLAHGGLRSNPQMAGWIAGRLAAQGRLVAVAHPPVLGAGAARAAVEEIRLRPGDLEATLSAVEADPAVRAHRAAGKVGAVGFFLGGSSVLALAGARLDTARLRAACDAPAEGPDCRWFAKSGVDLHAVVDERFAASHRDTRIGLVVAVAPEFLDRVQPDSLRGIDLPVTLIDLGPADSPARAAAALIPGLRVETLPDPTPFAAFSRCTPRAAVLLAEEGEDDALCRERPGRSRLVLHEEMARLIAAALAR
ncbi:alpha/beta hydrolase family protein [Ancylobacter amanitiformis]|uniref:Dienelactone hydrolase n=1 Tax=Ancylobacter amanitiformis TaxID=217069 RepID=A0ABU0LNQ5_9HYPH|nr:hypothetical protein [Ancylobacter amanitiformis]MDQ0510316.1 putative dienelactone hydrolase [Ancylobacter amanitiformis]